MNVNHFELLCYHSHTWSSCHLILLCIHDIDSMHMHAIGVPEGVTLLEFEGTCLEVEEPAQAQEVQPTEPDHSEEVVLQCP
jgi:hypothetical protein